MALDVGFTIEHKDLLLQENPTCLLKLTNSGNKPVQLLHPAFAHHLPILKVVEVKTGTETLFQCRAEMRPLAKPEELPAGKAIESVFPLMSIANLPIPGTYEISAIYEYNGTERAESRPLTVTIEPTTPRNFSLSSVQGNVVLGVWVNLSDPPQVVWSRFDLVSKGGVGAVGAIEKATLHTRPVMSLPPNRVVATTHWVAWLDERVLKFTWFSERGEVGPVGKYDLPAAEVEIVEPLRMEAPKGAEPANGSVLLHLADRDSGISRLRVVDLAGKKAAAGAEVDLAGVRPDWIACHERSTGQRIISMIHTAGERVVLKQLSWPRAGTASPQAKELCTWKGRLLAAGATLGFDDVLYGSALIQAEGGAAGTMSLVGWQIDAKEKLTPRKAEGVEWDSSRAVERALVRVSARGTGAALVRDRNGAWWVCDSIGRVQPAPAPFAKTSLPIEMGFFSERPVLICAGAGRGYTVVMADGTPLPDPSW